MAMPVGIQRKTKDNSKKKFREHDEWMQGKKIGRPKQVFVDTRSVFGSTEEIEKLTHAQLLALPRPHWEKVSV